MEGDAAKKDWNMKSKLKMKILIIAMLILGLNAQSQSIILQDKEERAQDSMDLVRCMVIVRDLFDGELIKDDSLREDHLAYDYYWGKPCDSADPEFYWILCDRFKDTYKEHLTESMYDKMIEGDMHRYTKEMGNGRCIMLHWAWVGPDGKYDEIYFDFTIYQEKIQLVYIRKYLSDFWADFQSE